MLDAEKVYCNFFCFEQKCTEKKNITNYNFVLELKLRFLVLIRKSLKV